jgi:3-dehydroquinate dehydratase-2
MLHIAIINGPNLNLVGMREPHIYGTQTIEDYIQQLQKKYPQITFHSYQSNIEGELINYIHACRNVVQGIILNGGAYTHTSIALADALASVNIPTIEVHISNIYARESFRKNSFTAAQCIGCITGLGLNGYALAVSHFLQMLLPEAS